MRRLGVHGALACVAAPVALIACGASTANRTMTRGSNADAADAAAATSALADAADAGSSDAVTSFDTSATSPAPLPALPPLPFGTRPDRNAPLTVVVDGHCVGLGVSLLPDRTMIHWAENAGTLATIDERGAVHEVSRIADVSGIDGVIGSFADHAHAWMLTEYGGRCDSRARLNIWTNGRWQLLSPDANDDSVASYTLLGDTLYFATAGSSAGCGPHDDERGFFFGEGKKAPKLDEDGAFLEHLESFPGGEIVALARIRGSEKRELRIASAAGSIRRVPVPGSSTFFTAFAADDIDMLSDEQDHLERAHWNGSSVSVQSYKLPGKPVLSGSAAGLSLQRSPSGELWLAHAGALYRLTAPELTPIPTPAPLRSLSGVAAGAPWITMTDGSLAKWTTDHWTSVPLPKPPFAESATFSAQYVVVRDARDVWVNATYVEKPDGWGSGVHEDHRALLRTLPADETLHCGGNVAFDAYSMAEWGFHSWPPTATDGCTTPLVLLSDNISRKPSDYKRTRALVAKRPEFAGATYEEIVADDHRFLAARVPTVQMGKAMVAFYAGKIANSKPRLVCANPAPAQTFD